MQQTYNGMPTAELQGAQWQKSGRSQGVSNCVEMARLASGEVALRNSRHPEGPALIYPQAEIQALIQGARDGDFDNLLQ